MADPFSSARFSPSLLNLFTQEVIEEKGMRLSDRVAFACRYLPDEALEKYIEKQMQVRTGPGGITNYLSLNHLLVSIFFFPACLSLFNSPGSNHSRPTGWSATYWAHARGLGPASFLCRPHIRCADREHARYCCALISWLC